MIFTMIELNVAYFFTELESRIEHLRDIKRRYLQVLGLSRAFTSHFYHVIQTQVCIMSKNFLLELLTSLLR